MLTSCICIVIFIGIAASTAGMGGVTTSPAGRIGDFGTVAMAHSRYSITGIGIATLCTGMRGETICRTGRRGDFSFVVMAQGGSELSAALSAGLRSGTGCFITFGMTTGRNGFGIGITAAGAGIHSLAIFRAGRVGSYAHIFMAQRLFQFSTAHSAGLRSGTGCFITFGMTLGDGFFSDIAAHSTSIDLFAILCTSGIRICYTTSFSMRFANPLAVGVGIGIVAAIGSCNIATIAVLQLGRGDRDSIRLTCILAQLCSRCFVTRDDFYFTAFNATDIRAARSGVQTTFGCNYLTFNFDDYIL